MRKSEYLPAQVHTPNVYGMWPAVPMRVQGAGGILEVKYVYNLLEQNIGGNCASMYLGGSAILHGSHGKYA